MVDSRERHADREWVPATAKVTGCKLKLASASVEGDASPEYEVTFSYDVDGRTFTGSYTATWPQEWGHTFDIVYDPAHPGNNSGGDVHGPNWFRWTAIALAICLTLLAIWAWGDTDWFRY